MTATGVDALLVRKFRYRFCGPSTSSQGLATGAIRKFAVHVMGETNLEPHANLGINAYLFVVPGAEVKHAHRR
jgi:hypothetical protein